VKYQNPRHSEKIQTFRNLEGKKKRMEGKDKKKERRAGEQNISHTISRLLTNTRSMKARGSQTKPTKSENDF